MFSPRKHKKDEPLDKKGSSISPHHGSILPHVLSKDPKRLLSKLTRKDPAASYTLELSVDKGNHRREEYHNNDQYFDDLSSILGVDKRKFRTDTVDLENYSEQTCSSDSSGSSDEDSYWCEIDPSWVVDEEEQEFIRKWERKWERKKQREAKQLAGSTPLSTTHNKVTPAKNNKVAQLQRKKGHRRSISLGSGDIEEELRKSEEEKLKHTKKTHEKKEKPQSQHQPQQQQPQHQSPPPLRESQSERSNRHKPHTLGREESWRRRSGTTIFFDTLSFGSNTLLEGGLVLRSLSEDHLSSTRPRQNSAGASMLRASMGGQPPRNSPKISTTNNLNTPPPVPPRQPVNNNTNNNTTTHTTPNNNTTNNNTTNNNTEKGPSPPPTPHSQGVPPRVPPASSPVEEEEESIQAEKEDIESGEAVLEGLLIPVTESRKPGDKNTSPTTSWKFITTGLWKKESARRMEGSSPLQRSRMPRDPLQQHSAQEDGVAEGGEGEGEDHRMTEEEALKIVRCMRLEWEWERKKWLKEKHELMREISRLNSTMRRQCPKCGDFNPFVPRHVEPKRRKPSVQQKDAATEGREETEEQDTIGTGIDTTKKAATVSSPRSRLVPTSPFPQSASVSQQLPSGYRPPPQQQQTHPGSGRGHNSDGSEDEASGESPRYETAPGLGTSREGQGLGHRRKKSSSEKKSMLMQLRNGVDSSTSADGGSLRSGEYKW